MVSAWDVPHLAAGSLQPTMDPNQVYVYNMRFCPYAQRAILALLAKNVSFKVININLKKKPDWFVETTFGKAPVMLYKGEIIPESLITADYVDEMFAGTQLHPKDPTQKAKDRVVLEIFNRVVSGFYKCLYAKDEEAQATAVKDLTEHLQTVETELKKRSSKFFCGEQPGMLDYMMWPWLERISVITKFGMIQPVVPGMDEYIANMWKTDVVKKYGLNADDHYKFLKQYKDQKEDIDFDFLINK